MLEAANPADDALDAHAEAAVRDGAEPAQIEIPLECFLRQVRFEDGRTGTMRANVKIREARIFTPQQVKKAG